MTMSFSGKTYRILVDLIYEHSRIRLGADKQTLLAIPLQMPKARNQRMPAHLTRVVVLRPMGKGVPAAKGVRAI